MHDIKFWQSWLLLLLPGLFGPLLHTLQPHDTIIPHAAKLAGFKPAQQWPRLLQHLGVN